MPANENLPAKKRIALVAHDGRKDDLVEWVKHNREELAHHELFGTGGTAALIAKETGLTVNPFMSGPWAATSRSVRPSQPASWIC